MTHNSPPSDVPNTQHMRHSYRAPTDMMTMGMKTRLRRARKICAVATMPARKLMTAHVGSATTTCARHIPGVLPRQTTDTDTVEKHRCPHEHVQLARAQTHAGFSGRDDVVAQSHGRRHTSQKRYPLTFKCVQVEYFGGVQHARRPVLTYGHDGRYGVTTGRAVLLSPRGSPDAADTHPPQTHVHM